MKNVTTLSGMRGARPWRTRWTRRARETQFSWYTPVPLWSWAPNTKYSQSVNQFNKQTRFFVLPLAQLSQHDILPTGPGRPDLPARPGGPAEPGGPGGPMGPGGPLPTGTPKKQRDSQSQLLSSRKRSIQNYFKIQVGNHRLNLNVLWTSVLSLCIFESYALWCVHCPYDRSAMVCKHLRQSRVSSRRLLICFVWNTSPWLGLKISITLPLLLQFVPLLLLLKHLFDILDSSQCLTKVLMMVSEE